MQMVQITGLPTAPLLVPLFPDFQDAHLLALIVTLGDDVVLTGL